MSASCKPPPINMGPKGCPAQGSPETPLILFDPETGKQIFCLHKDGEIEVDWYGLMVLKDRFVAGDYQPNDLYIYLAAAIWLAHNT